MTERALSAPPQSEEAPKNTLQFRPFLRTGELVLKAVGLGGMVLVAAAWGLAALGGGAHGMAGWLVLFSFPVILWLEGHFLYRPLASRRVHILGSGLRVETLGKGTQIPFSELESIKIVHIPCAVGLLKVRTNAGAKFNFPITLIRSDLLLDALAAARPDLFPNLPKFFSYRRTAIIADRSFDRLKEIRAGWLGILGRVVGAALPTILLPWAFGKAFSPGVACGALMISMGFWFVCYSGAEWVIIFRERKFLIESPGYGPRNLAFERWAFEAGNWAHFGVVFGLGLVLFAVGLSG